MLGSYFQICHQLFLAWTWSSRAVKALVQCKDTLVSSASISCARKCYFAWQNCSSGRAPSWLLASPVDWAVALISLSSAKVMQVGENEGKKMLLTAYINWVAYCILERTGGSGALHTAAWREEILSPGIDRDVSGSGETCWRQYTHYRGSHGGKSWMTNPCVLLTSTKKPCACPANTSPAARCFYGI